MIETTTAVVGEDALDDDVDEDDDVGDVDSGTVETFFLDAVNSESIEKLSLTLGVTGAVALDSVVSMVTMP